MWGVERGLPLQKRDVLSASQFPKRWFCALDVRDGNLILLSVQCLETLKMLVVGRSLSYINIKQHLKTFLFVSSLITPSPILAVPQGPNFFKARPHARGVKLCGFPSCYALGLLGPLNNADGWDLSESLVLGKSVA